MRRHHEIDDFEMFGRDGFLGRRGNPAPAGRAEPAGSLSSH
jgi:hypothetical protein